MKQILCKCFFNVSFGGSTVYLNLAGRGDATAIGGAEFNPIVCSVAGTIRNLSVLSEVVHANVAVTLQVNQVDTALTTTLASGSTLASNSTDGVLVAAGDTIQLKAVTTQNGCSDLGVSIEFEGDQQIYGVTRTAHNMIDGGTLYAGALGNGFWSGTGPVSATYSICSVPGTLTRTDLHSFSGNPMGGTFTAYVVVNGITQNGSGATVNTACVISGLNTTAVSTYSLPIALTDRVELQFVRNGAGSLVTEVCAGVAFTPTDGNSFMLTGGSNNTVGSGVAVWVCCDQDVLSISRAVAPVGPRGLVALGLYGEYSASPGPGNTITDTLLSNSTPTAIALTFVEPDTSQSDTGSVPFAAGDTIAIGITRTGSPIGSQFHWGLAAQAATEPAPTTETVAIRRLRRSAHLSRELFWQFIDSFQLDLETGVGLSTGQGSDPQIMLRISKDGGFTWSHEQWTSAGAIGAYSQRAIWHRLGRGRDLVFEISMSDPVAWAIFDAFIDGSGGTS